MALHYYYIASIGLSIYRKVLITPSGDGKVKAALTQWSIAFYDLNRKKLYSVYLVKSAYVSFVINAKCIHQEALHVWDKATTTVALLFSPKKAFPS